MRSRELKPGFFKNEILASLLPHARLLFQGLWCIADKEGRLEDRPQRIRAELFPYEDVDVAQLLTSLHERGFIERYRVSGNAYIQVVAFRVHQHPHPREMESVIPPMPIRVKARPRHCLGNAKDMPRHGSAGQDLLCPSVPSGSSRTSETPHVVRCDTRAV